MFYFNNLIDYLNHYEPVFYVFVVILGLLVGSFLNVVIHRLPIMMERQWAEEARYIMSLLDKGISLIKPQDSITINNEEQEEKESESHFNLMLPHSHCPKCKHMIKPWENIPVVSYLLLGRKCSQCSVPISIRYPLVELVTALLGLMVAYRYGVSWTTICGLFFTWSLLSLTMIDFDTQLLPDQIVFPLLWAGLLLNYHSIIVPLDEAVLGTVFGYLSLWSVYWLFKICTGKEGMGYGDFKLLAALGAWLGYKSIVSVILISSLTGAIVGISLILIKGRSRQIPIAFGPYLALGGWLYFLYPNTFLKLFHLSY